MTLKVTSVRYYNTRQGVGYECKTNIDSVKICNDGDGGGTFVEGYKIAVRSGKTTGIGISMARHGMENGSTHKRAKDHNYKHN